MNKSEYIADLESLMPWYVERAREHLEENAHILSVVFPLQESYTFLSPRQKAQTRRRVLQRYGFKMNGKRGEWFSWIVASRASKPVKPVPTPHNPKGAQPKKEINATK